MFKSELVRASSGKRSINLINHDHFSPLIYAGSTAAYWREKTDIKKIKINAHHDEIKAVRKDRGCMSYG